MDIRKTTIFTIAACLLCLNFSALSLASLPAHTSQKPEHALINTAALAVLYPQTSDFLWIQNQLPDERAYLAIEFISNASLHGLNPNDYHYDLLLRLNPALPDADAHLFDLILSDGLLKLVKDMATGHLDPAVVDPKWSIPRKKFDAVAFVKQARLSDDFLAYLNTLIPDSHQYRQLLEAAVQYREYAQQDNWPLIPAPPILHKGSFHPVIATIRERLKLEGYELTTASANPNYYDSSLQRAVRQFQRQHSLSPDGIIGAQTIAEMNVPASKRLQQLYINMERIRWLPDDLGQRYIMVNLANYRLKAIENDTVMLDMRVIVGKKKRPTPSFSSEITHIVANPRWYVPGKLAIKDLLPKQQQNPDYFDRFNFRVFSNENGRKKEVDPDSIDWKKVTAQNFSYSLVQDPGRHNALGKLKFVVPNRWRIYLHDTPSKNLFRQSQRNFSSGCIRVEDPLALADFSMRDNHRQQPITEIINSEESFTTALEQPLSVYAVYSTVWLNGNAVTFSPDSYGRDKRMISYL